VATRYGTFGPGWANKSIFVTYSLKVWCLFIKLFLLNLVAVKFIWQVLYCKMILEHKTHCFFLSFFGCIPACQTSDLFQKQKSFLTLSEAILSSKQSFAEKMNQVMSKAYTCYFQITPTFCLYAFFSMNGGWHAEKHLLEKVSLNSSHFGMPATIHAKKC
jgi:hypothetical protein